MSCDLKGVVNRWEFDADKPKELLTVKALHGYDTTFRADIGGARGIAVHDSGEQLALSGITKVTNAFAGVGEIVVAVVDLKTGKLNRVLQSKDKTQGSAWGVARHPAGFWIGLSGGRGGGWLWFWKGGVKLEQEAEHEFFKLKLKNDGHLRTYSLNGV